jgi:energy-coupling factor transporter ATP-binding protein EcfA2
MKLKEFRVQNYRNVIDSGWIDINQVTAFVGQNEGGKSNLFEALYRLNPFETEDKYVFAEDWPVDRWEARDDQAIVCEARFQIDGNELSRLMEQASKPKKPEGEEGANEASAPAALPDPAVAGKITIEVTSYYDGDRTIEVGGPGIDSIDQELASVWVKANLPKLVYIRDYDLTGTQIELDHLATRYSQVKWAGLTADEQSVFIILKLAKIDINEFLKLGQTKEGRTLRSFDKRSASAYLTRKFQELWTQKDVRFDIDIDGPTLNIFAEDIGLGMPVRLKNRSTGFRWHVGFAWKFTYASEGDYAGCILLLEEPGIHLHYDGQKDLLKVFERLSEKNQILYTTHLASMIDPAFPERVLIVEVRDHHSTVLKGVVSQQRRPMAVIEARLGLTGDLSGLLGGRQTLIVEGGDDAVILQKLSGLMRASGKEALSDRIYPWPAEGATRTPMFAGFVIGNGWDGGVLLDSDDAGHKAKGKIKALYLDRLAKEGQQRFRIFMLGEAAGIKKTDAAIEDLFPDDFYLSCVNKSFGVNISQADLPADGSTLITKRVESVLTSKYGHKELDKRRVMQQMLKEFDGWSDASHLPKGSAAHIEKLFKAINKAFADPV